MARVAAVALKVLMLVGGFTVEVCPDCALLEVYLGVKEGDGVGRPLCCELDGVMVVVDVFEEGL